MHRLFMHVFQSDSHYTTSESFMHPSYLYQARVSIPTCVIVPPKQLPASQSITSAPARAAPMAADKPPGPLPTTSTWHLQTTQFFKHFLRSCVHPKRIYFYYFSINLKSVKNPDLSKIGMDLLGSAKRNMQISNREYTFK